MAKICNNLRKKEKKIVVAFLAVAVAVSTCACGAAGTSANIEPLELNQEYEAEKYVDFSLVKIQSSTKIEASMGNSIYYEKQNSGETYIDVILDVKNISENTISSQDLLIASAKSKSGKEYPCSLYAIETNNNTYISQYEDIAPFSTVRFHCGISVPNAEDEFTIKLTLNKDVFSYEYKMGETVSDVTPIKKGDKIENKEYASMTFKGTQYTNDLLPTDTSGFYTHYQIDNTENVYLVAKFDVTNYQDSSRDADTFVAVKAIYMDKYTYTGGVVVEDTDGSGFSAYEDIAPLSNRHLYYLIEVPKTVKVESGKIIINFDGKEYEYDL